jgi:serine/threonine protein kinase/beta-lactam-binding protein with PASTA domain
MSAGRLLGDRYQVGELLGYGGMAEVHRGRDLRLGRDVAIKMLRADLARDDNFQLRFQREAQNSASLNHPAIVAVYDTGEERGPNGENLPYIVMEFVNGHTLKEVLAGEGRLMPRRALEITADICAALEFSHRHGIIHRDVKPGNVMLTQTGQVKVMDFGIARALAGGATTMTQTSAVIGTAQYLSPEQARGEAVDARSDVYATGCVLYELITGHPPFVGDNPVSVAYQHVREDALPPSDSNRDVPPDVDAVVLKALAKNRMNRYQSAAEMRADLMRAASGRPVLATPVLRAQEHALMGPSQPPHSAGVRSAGGYATGAYPAGPVARVSAPRRRRSSTAAIVTLTLLGVVAVIALGIGLWLANRPPTSFVPNLAGKNSSDAASALQGENLTGVPKTSNDCAATQKGQVLTQNPGAGQKVQQRTTVEYTVCAGPASVTIPNLTGYSQADADMQLTQLGLHPKFDNVDSDKPKGTVVSTDPAANKTAIAGQEIMVHLSSQNMAQVPDVSGLSRSQAMAKLRNAGFTDVRAVDYTVNDPSQVGLVQSQDPAANSVKKLSTTIRCYVGVLAAQSPSPSPSPSPSLSISPSSPSA